MRAHHLILLAALAAGCVSFGAAQEPRTDRHGDPLPEGAVARLGTVRLRGAGEVQCVDISPDGKLVAAVFVGSVRVFHRESGREYEALCGKTYAEAVAFRPTGKTLVAGPAPVQPQQPEASLPRAFHFRNTVYLPQTDADCYVTVLHARLDDPRDVRSTSVSVHDVPRPHFSVSHGHLWVSSAISPLGKGDTSLLAERLMRYRLEEFKEGKLVTAPGAASDSEFASRFAPASPVKDFRILGRMCAFKANLWYDYLPTGEAEVLLFALTDARGSFDDAGGTGEVSARVVRLTPEEKETPKWTLSVWAYAGAKFDKDKGFWKLGGWTRKEWITPRFEEPFRVAAVGDAYYFVTESGKVFRSPKGEKGKDRPLETVWDDKTRPVKAYLTDADSGKSFCFVPPAKEGEKAGYFELSAKPEVLPCPAEPLVALKPKDPMPSMLKLAQFLKDQKKIKGE